METCTNCSTNRRKAMRQTAVMAVLGGILHKAVSVLWDVISGAM